MKDSVAAKVRIVLGIMLLVFAGIAAAARGGEPQWRVGLAQVKITPEQPVFLAGYSARNKPFTSVAADLYAKALAIEDSAGNRAVLVTSDLIGFRAEVAESICQRIQEQIDLGRAQILLNASHTHTGPALGLDPTPRGNMSAEDARKTVAYTRRLQDLVVDLVVRAVGELEPANLSWASGVATFVMNRREFTPQGVRLGVNPRGLVDRSVPVLRVDGGGGKLRAVVFGCACHNTTLTGRHYSVSGDYAGFAQATIQERYPGVQAMFMAGCGGSANPYPRGTLELAQSHGATLGNEVCRVLDGELQPVGGPLSVAYDHVDLPLKRPPSPSELEKMLSGRQGWQRFVARRMLDLLQQGTKPPTHYTAPIALWQFGSDLTLVGLSGEVVVDYVALLEEALGPLRLWIAGYSNDVFGYLPSAQVLRQGGYETRGLIYGGIGMFDPEVQELVVAKTKQLAQQAGRKLP